MKIFYFLLIFNSLIISSFAQIQSLDDKYFTANLFFEKENFAEAKTLFLEIYEKQKNNDVLKKIALSEYFLNHFENAIQQFEKLEKFDKSFSTIYLSKCYAKLNRPEKAFIYLKHHLQSKNKWSEAQIKLDSDFETLKNSQSWKEIWLNDWYSANEMKLAEAEFYMKNEKRVEAIETLDDVLQQDNELGKAFFLRATLFFDFEDYKNAFLDAKKAVEIEKYNQYYLILYVKICNKLKKNKLALENCENLLKIDRFNLNFYCLRAETNSFLENYQQSIDDINLCLKYDGENENLIFQKVQYQIKLGETWEALKAVNQLIAKNPKPDYLLERGKLFLQTNNWNAAKTDFSQVIDYMPNTAEAYYQLALISLKENDKKNACFFLKKAQKLGFSEAAELLEKNCTE
jgi:tetratricopeptide (TPR) repeat protein